MTRKPSVKRKKDLKELLTSFPVALAYCHVARIFRPFARRNGIGFLAIIVVPNAELSAFYNTATEYVLRGASAHGIRRFDDPIKVVTVGKGKANFSHILGDTQERKPTVFLFDNAQDVPAEFRIAADIFEIMNAPDVAVSHAAIYQMCGTMVSDADAQFVLEQPWQRTAAAFRHGRSANRTLRLLRSFSAVPTKTVAPSPTAAEDRMVGLEDLAGYGEAGIWGLQLAKDLIAFDDVIAFLPDVVQMPADRLMTTAIHESGHALIGLAVGRTIEKARLADRFIRGSDRIVLGGVHFLQDLVPRRTRQFYLDEIAISLAGIAAEVEITGSFDDGAGSSRSSDLANATRLATMLEGVLGMGDSLISDANELGDDHLEKLRSRSPKLCKRVERVLTAQMAFATELVVENRQLVLGLAALFVERIEISGEEIERFVKDRKLNSNPIPDSNVKPLRWLGGRLS